MIFNDKEIIELIKKLESKLEDHQKARIAAKVELVKQLNILESRINETRSSIDELFEIHSHNHTALEERVRNLEAVKPPKFKAGQGKRKRVVSIYKGKKLLGGGENVNALGLKFFPKHSLNFLNQHIRKHEKEQGQDVSFELKGFTIESRLKVD